MIVQCSDCRTRYQLEPELVPHERIRVRCPKCAGVFSIDGTQRAVAPPSRPSAPVAPAAPAPRTASRPARPVSAAVPPAAPLRPSSPVTPVGSVPSAASRSYGDIDLDATPVATPSPAPQAAPVADSGPALEMDLEIERPSIEPIAPTRRAPSSGATAGFASEMGAVTGGGAATATAAPPRPAANPTDDKARRLARALVSDILVYNREARDRSLAEGNLVQVMGQEIKKSWEMYKDKVTPEVANSTNHFREALNEVLANGQQIF